MILQPHFIHMKVRFTILYLPNFWHWQSFNYKKCRNLFTCGSTIEFTSYWPIDSDYSRPYLLAQVNMTIYCQFGSSITAASYRFNVKQQNTKNFICEKPRLVKTNRLIETKLSKRTLPLILHIHLLRAAKWIISSIRKVSKEEKLLTYY